MLELKNISYSVDNDGVRKDILKNVNLTVDEGFAVITGPNGSGKSTLAKIIAGIITPTSGQIFLDGVDITPMSITERANAGISFAFQRPVKFKGITVKDLIMLAAGGKIKYSQALEYLTEVGLDAKQYIFREVNGSLSGGELKRIEIAMVLARGTKLSIFDEPEAGIDLWSFNSLIKVFAHLHDNVGGNMIIITHQERILDIADKIILLSGGEVKCVGTKEEVMPLIIKAEEN